MNPDALFHLLWIQLIQVTIVALTVMLIVRLGAKKHPHLTHALWALVLLKCITPPIWASPLGVFSWCSVDAVILDAPVHVSATSRFSSTDWTITNSSNGNAISVTDRKGWNASAVLTPARNRWVGLSSMIVLGWLVISAVVAGSLLFRLLKLMRWIRHREQMASEPLAKLQQQVQDLTDELAKQLDIRWRVKASVCDHHWGPAVVGLFRPKILLPRVIVQSSTNEDLRILIAHELVHFRRGDLWWAMLQSAALIVTWFHPLCWLISRRFTDQTEQCCDKETIERLGIAPAAYARSLVSVLETKYRLQAAPLLPGVKPVEITASRLEKIMRMEEGIRRSCPVWVHLTLLMGALLVLPGMSITNADEGTGKTQSQNNDSATPGAKAVDVPNASALSDKKSNVEYRKVVETHADPFFYTGGLLPAGKFPLPRDFDLDVLGAVALAHGTTPQHGTQDVERIPDGMLTVIRTVDGRKVSIEVDLQAARKNPKKRPLVQAGDTLVLHPKTQAMLKAPQTLVVDNEANRETKNEKTPILIHKLKIVEAPSDEHDTTTRDWEWKGGESDPQVSRPLSTQQAQRLISIGELVTAPTIKIVDGTTGSLSLGADIPSNAKPVQVTDKDSKSEQVVFEGIKIQVTSKYISESDEIAVTLQYEQSAVPDGRQAAEKSAGGKSNGSQRFTSQFRVPEGKTVAISLGTQKRSTVTQQSVPVLSNVPYLGRLFVNSVLSSEHRSKTLLLESRRMSDDS